MVEQEIALTAEQEKFLETAHPSWREVFINQAIWHNTRINSEWTLGFKDRGLGYGDYAVITKDGDLVVPCSTKEMAEYLINLHNSRKNES